MRIIDSPSVQGLLSLCEMGASKGWNAFIGCGVSKWLQSAELLGMEAELNWTGEFRPAGIKVSRLARECFLVTGARVRQGGGPREPDGSLYLIQVNDDGTMYRTLWESEDDAYPPLELALHLVAHAARSTGPGNVVYRCQPVNTVALAALVMREQGDFMAELAQGYQSVHNVIPEGVACIPWGMPAPVRRGFPMTAPMMQEMDHFLGQVRETTAIHEAVVFSGEGLLCATFDENVAFGLASTIERAAEIRLKMRMAGGV